MRPAGNRRPLRRTDDWAHAEDLTSVVVLECWRRRDVALSEGEVLPSPLASVIAAGDSAQDEDARVGRIGLHARGGAERTVGRLDHGDVVLAVDGRSRPPA
jgi:hypothetical protein